VGIPVLALVTEVVPVYLTFTSSVLVTPALHEMRNQPISTQWTVFTLCGIENTILYVAGSEERGYFMPIPNFGFKNSSSFEAVIATDLKLAMNILTLYFIYSVQCGYTR